MKRIGLFITCIIVAIASIFVFKGKQEVNLITPLKKNIEQQEVEGIEIPARLDNISELILKRKAYTVSYNPENLIPNWVAWKLKAEYVEGNLPRYNKFMEDESIPKPRATLGDYYKSGWIRGHMFPAGDAKWDVQAMKESFLLTNICPQNARLNSGDWNEIEIACRKWAKEYGEIYIVCGPVFYDRAHQTIGKNRVVVPEAFFKVILCLNPDIKAIGFVCKNISDNKTKEQYVNSVDEIEKITGMDFFPLLEDSIENIIESSADISLW